MLAARLAGRLVQQASFGRLAALNALLQMSDDLIRDLEKSEDDPKFGFVPETVVLNSPSVADKARGYMVVDGVMKTESSLGFNWETHDAFYGQTGRMYINVPWIQAHWPRPTPLTESIARWDERYEIEALKLDPAWEFWRPETHLDLQNIEEIAPSKKRKRKRIKPLRVRRKAMTGVEFSVNTGNGGVRVTNVDPPRTRGKGEKKSGGNTAMAILGAALDLTSEGREYWEIIREASNAPDDWSDAQFFAWLYDGGWETLDWSEIAYGFAMNVIVDKIIGRLQGHVTRALRDGAGLHHWTSPGW